MVDNFEELTALLQSIVVAVDAEISLLVLGLGLLYCIVGISSLRALDTRRDASEEIEELRGEIQGLSRQIEELKGQLSGLNIPAPRGEVVAPEVAPPPPFQEVAASVAEIELQPQQPAAVPQQPAVLPQQPAVAPEAVPIVPVSVPEVPVASSISRGMAKSRTSFLSRIKSLFSARGRIDLSSLDELEEMLIASDVGARVADSLVSSVREAVSGSGEVSEEHLRDLLKDGIRKELIPVPVQHRMYQPVGSPLVVLVVGVNGVGKTTTVAKLATRYKEQGKRVLAVAADTFRAAAVQQLNEWGARSDFPVFSGAENAKPAAVVFDGMVAAKEQGVDVVLIDTAGRLHTKSNLMQELEGVRNSIRRHVPDAPHETVLVVDGVSGQNALAQAREFNACTPLTGLVVTKLDGTPKGGIIVAISQELKIPVLYVGVGEKAKDLLPFSVDEFVEGLLVEEGSTSGSSTHGIAADVREGTAVQM